MKRFFCIIVVCLSVFSIHAQTTIGSDFWLTFGKNNCYPSGIVTLQIRIVSGNSSTSGRIEFTNLGTYVEFNISAHQVYTYNLNATEKAAVYNMVTGVSNRSVHITTNKDVTVYAMNAISETTDATNILPVTTLGTDFYQISYTPFDHYEEYFDAYAVVAIENNTHVYHDGTLTVTLNEGEVYYRTSATDMTGAHITTDAPVAFFAVTQSASIPVEAYAGSDDCLFQQLAPVHTWGKNFFVPVSDPLFNNNPVIKDRVRIVVSEDNTNITQVVGGTIKSAIGSQMSLTNLQAGQFVELEIVQQDKGCYIQSEKPIEVCTYLVSNNYGIGVSSPAQAWIPAIEQMISEVTVSSFVPVGNSNLLYHGFLIVTPTATKNNTQVSIDGGAYEYLIGNWQDNSIVGISYLSLQSNNISNHHFINPAGLFIMCYGIGVNESYYYLAGSAMRDLTLGFYANNIYYTELQDNLICTHEVNFHAAVTNMSTLSEHLKWYIDDVEQPLAEDQEDWSHTFSVPGAYQIKMWVLPEVGEAMTITGTLHIGATITVEVEPEEYGTIEGMEECYKVGSEATLFANPYHCYVFVNWTDEDENELSTDNPYTFTVNGDINLIAHFIPKGKNAAKAEAAIKEKRKKKAEAEEKAKGAAGEAEDSSFQSE